MGSLSYLLDSTVLIDVLNRVPGSLEFLQIHVDQSAVSPVTRAEVLAGVKDEDAEDIGAWLSEFDYLPLDLKSVDLAASLRRQHRWKLPDAFQAAMAMHYKLKLVTRNTKDFPPEKFDFVTVPYKI